MDSGSSFQSKAVEASLACTVKSARKDEGDEKDFLFHRLETIESSLNKKMKTYLQSGQQKPNEVESNYYMNKHLYKVKDIPCDLKVFSVVEHMESIYDKFEDPTVLDEFYEFLFVDEDVISDCETSEIAEESFRNNVLDSLSEAVIERELDDGYFIIDDFEYEGTLFENLECLKICEVFDEKDVDELDLALQDILIDLIDADTTEEVEGDWEDIIDATFNIKTISHKIGSRFDCSMDDPGYHKYGEKFYYEGLANDSDCFVDFGLDYVTQKVEIGDDIINKMKKKMDKILCKHDDCPPPFYLFLKNNDREFLHRYIHSSSQHPACPSTELVEKITRSMDFYQRSKKIKYLPVPPREPELADPFSEAKRMLNYKVIIPKHVALNPQEEDSLKTQLQNRMWL